MTNQKGASAVLFILVLILLLAVGGGGYYVYKQKLSETLPPRTAFDHINLNEDVIVFLFQKIPGLYSRIAQIDTELTLIASELERIGELENEYPSGKKYVVSERAVWIRLQNSLQTSVQFAQKTIDSYYVAYMVNSEKGAELINESLNDLLSRLDEVLAQSKKETKRLKVVKDRTLMERLKALIKHE